MCCACSLLARCLLHLSSRRRRSVGAQSGKRALWWRSFTKSIALRRAALSKEVERIDRFKELLAKRAKETPEDSEAF